MMMRSLLFVPLLASAQDYECKLEDYAEHKGKMVHKDSYIKVWSPKEMPPGDEPQLYQTPTDDQWWFYYNCFHLRCKMSDFAKYKDQTVHKDHYSKESFWSVLNQFVGISNDQEFYYANCVALAEEEKIYIAYEPKGQDPVSKEYGLSRFFPATEEAQQMFNNLLQSCCDGDPDECSKGGTDDLEGYNKCLDTKADLSIKCMKNPSLNGCRNRPRKPDDCKYAWDGALCYKKCKCEDEVGGEMIEVGEAAVGEACHTHDANICVECKLKNKDEKENPFWRILAEVAEDYHLDGDQCVTDAQSKAAAGEKTYNAADAKNLKGADYGKTWTCKTYDYPKGVPADTDTYAAKTVKDSRDWCKGSDEQLCWEHTMSDDDSCYAPIKIEGEAAAGATDGDVGEMPENDESSVDEQYGAAEPGDGKDQKDGCPACKCPSGAGLLRMSGEEGDSSSATTIAAAAPILMAFLA